MNNNDYPNDFLEFRIINSFTLEVTPTAQFDTSGSASNSAASPLTVNPESEIEPLILLAEDNEANIQTFSSYLIPKHKEEATDDIREKGERG
jgi:hypothetical protein